MVFETTWMLSRSVFKCLKFSIFVLSLEIMWMDKVEKSLAPKMVHAGMSVPIFLGIPFFPPSIFMVIKIDANPLISQNALWAGGGTLGCIHLGPVHKQSQVNYNELELQFKSISSNFIGWICFQAHSYLARLCEPGPELVGKLTGSSNTRSL